MIIGPLRRRPFDPIGGGAKCLGRDSLAPQSPQNRAPGLAPCPQYPQAIVTISRTLSLGAEHAPN